MIWLAAVSFFATLVAVLWLDEIAIDENLSFVWPLLVAIVGSCVTAYLALA